MTMIRRPVLLIADEPATALDVTIQKQILDLMAEMRAETGAAMLLITHDMGVVAESADRVAVMYAGRVVESGPVAQVFARPRHPYTTMLYDHVAAHDPKAGRHAQGAAARHSGRGARYPQLAQRVPVQHPLSAGV